MGLSVSGPSNLTWSMPLKNSFSPDTTATSREQEFSLTNREVVEGTVKKLQK
jgi:hypothetical protein